MTDCVFRSRRVVTPEGTRPAAIHVAGGRIVGVHPYDRLEAGAAVVDAGDAVILPGLVDTHVHVNEPGRTEWEGFGIVFGHACSVPIAVGQIKLCFHIATSSLAPEGFHVDLIVGDQSGEAHDEAKERVSEASWWIHGASSI